jgi:hypothetical protein
MHIRLSLALAFALLGSLSPAAIVISVGPGNFPNDENVLFNDDRLEDDDFLVQGITNQTGQFVDLYGAGEVFLTPSGGQARVEAADGLFTELTVAMTEPGINFTTLIWNINADEDGMVAFTVYRTGGSPHVQVFDLDRAGENWFRFEGLGESMSSVRLESSVGIQDVRQIRLGAVPEPGTLLALGFGAAALFARRRSKRA